MHNFSCVSLSFVFIIFLPLFLLPSLVYLLSLPLQIKNPISSSSCRLSLVSYPTSLGYQKYLVLFNFPGSVLSGFVYRRSLSFSISIKIWLLGALNLAYLVNLCPSLHTHVPHSFSCCFRHPQIGLAGSSLLPLPHCIC